MSTFEKLRLNIERVTGDSNSVVPVGKCPLDEYDTFDVHHRTSSWFQWSNAFEHLRKQCPVGRSEMHGGHWVVTGYPELMQIINDPETFSSEHIIIPPFPKASRMVPIEIDPPDHLKYRRILMRAFSSRMVTTMHEERVRRRVNEIIDGFIEAGHTDVFQSVAIPLPAFMTTTILGLPDEDERRLCDWAHKLVHVAVADPAVAGQATEEIYVYFGEKLQQRRGKADGGDMLSILLRADVDGDVLSWDELLGFCLLLLLAGIDTTQKIIGSIFWQLGTDRELLQDIAAHPEIIPDAVEEFIRYWAPNQPGRVVTKDVTVGGVRMQKGDNVLMMIMAANRDSRKFPDGDSFDPRRQQNRHIGFGANVHRCLGSHIARLELQILLEEFLRRIPDFEVKDQRKVRWAPGQVQGIIEAPIRFSVARDEE